MRVCEKQEYEWEAIKRSPKEKKERRSLFHVVVRATSSTLAEAMVMVLGRVGKTERRGDGVLGIEFTMCRKSRVSRWAILHVVCKVTLQPDLFIPLENQATT